MRKSSAYGTGRVFRAGYTKNGVRHETKAYWIAYYVNGKEKREPAKTTVFTEALKMLKLRQAGVSAAKTGDTPQEPITIEKLIDLIEADYLQEGRRSIMTLRRSRFPHLRAYFGTTDLSKIDGAALKKYRDHRKAQKASNGSVNREVAVVTRAMRLAEERNMITAVPHVKKLNENNARSGFFEWDTFQLLLTKIDPWWHELYTTAYITGWRIDDELCPLTWAQVDFMNKMLRLDPGTTKNDEGRNFPFTPLLEKTLKVQRLRVDALQKDKDRIVKWVFPREHTKGRGVACMPLTSAYKPFKRAAIALGLKRLQHDFRRTAVRNLENAGVPRPTAKRMVGHKTDSMYERYNIVDKKSIEVGREKLAEYEAKVLAFAETEKRERPKGA